MRHLIQFGGSCKERGCGHRMCPGNKDMLKRTQNDQLKMKRHF